MFQFKKINLGIVVAIIGIIALTGCGTAGKVGLIDAPERTVTTFETTSIDQNLITVSSNVSPANDLVIGAAGAVKAGATVSVYADPALITLVASGTAAQNGSFQIDIGDDLLYDMYIVATASNSAPSATVQKLNNI